MKKIIWILLVAFYVSGCSSTQKTVPLPKPAGITGDWSYSNGNGEAFITQNGSDVTILMSYKPNSAPRPHYRVTLVREGDILSGSWICLIKGFRGCGKTNNVKFKIDPSYQSIIVLEGQDPDRHGIKQGFTLYRL